MDTAQPSSGKRPNTFSLPFPVAHDKPTKARPDIRARTGPPPKAPRSLRSVPRSRSGTSQYFSGSFLSAPESGRTSESKAHDIYVTIGPDFDILIQPTNYFTKAIFKFVKDNEDSIMLVKDPLPKNRETIGRLFDASKRREEYLEERITHSMDAIQYNSNKKSDFKIISHYYGGYNHMFNIHYVFVSDPELYNKFLDAKFVSLTAQKEDRTIDTDSCEKMVFFGNDKKPFAKQENTNKHLL